MPLADNILKNHFNEQTSLSSLGEMPKGVQGVLTVDKNKKKRKAIDLEKRKKIAKKVQTGEKYTDTYPKEITAKKRMVSGDLQIEEGWKGKVFITDIPESKVYDITFSTGEIFNYENKEEASKDWKF
jgi:hypothetical protein